MNIIIAPPCSRTVTESIGQWTEPYTGRRDPNSSRNVRLHLSVSVLITDKTSHLRPGRTLGGCPTGEARVTAGYNLPA
jgi:hypothetical protein